MPGTQFLTLQPCALDRKGASWADTGCSLNLPGMLSSRRMNVDDFGLRSWCKWNATSRHWGKIECNVTRCDGRREKTTVLDSRTQCRHSICRMSRGFWMFSSRVIYSTSVQDCASMGRNRQSICSLHVTRPWVPDWSAICPIACQCMLSLPPSACCTIFHDWTVWYQHLVAKIAVVLPATKPWSIHVNSFNCSNVKEDFHHCQENNIWCSLDVRLQRIKELSTEQGSHSFIRRPSVEVTLQQCV